MYPSYWPHGSSESVEEIHSYFDSAYTPTRAKEFQIKTSASEERHAKLQRAHDRAVIELRREVRRLMRALPVMRYRPEQHRTHYCTRRGRF